MAYSSNIEWTETTWNPVTGCTKISPGCKNCYALGMTKRLHSMGSPNYANGFIPTVHPHMLERPLHWKKSQTVFVNSMSDLFHDDIPLEFIQKVFNIMARAHWHCFQILTKRAGRLAELSRELMWAPNIWMGVSVENERYQSRIDCLRSTQAKLKFLSLEPLLAPLPNLDLSEIDWVIVGGESGPKSRPVDLDWITDIRDQCIDSNVPFFFKQWGGKNKKKAGRLLEGRTWDQMPDAIA